MTTTAPNPDLPYYGASREDVAALGANPDDVETGRLAARENQQQQARLDEKGILLAATEAVENGEMTEAEAARALAAAGLHSAHSAFVQQWQAEESAPSEWDVQEAIEALAYLSADEYVEHFTEQQARQRVADEANVADLQRQLSAQHVADLQKDIKTLTESTPGAHRFAPAVEARLVRSIQESGVLPATKEERQAAIETALRTEAVVTSEKASIDAQVAAEWRALRKSNGARDGLVTQADVDLAENAYKTARFQQLADARMVNLETLKPGKTAEAQSAELAEKYRAKQEKSTEFHRTVARIGSGEPTTDRGEYSSAERKSYKLAYAEAESRAHYGDVRTTENAAHEAPTKSAGYGPNGTWPDELGPAL
jgi:hypothetical protein